MLKSIFIIICLSFNFTALSKSEVQPINHSFKLRKVIKKYSRKNLISDLRIFEKSTRPNRIIGTTGHRNAQKFLQSQLHNSLCGECGVIIDDFNYVHSKAIGGLRGAPHEFELKKIATKNKNYFETQQLKNIYWKKAGSSNETLVISVNYDSFQISKEGIDLSKRFPAANNNSSGVVVALALIKIIKNIKLKKGVLVAFTDSGVLGNQGIYRLGSFLKESKVNAQGILDFRMLGQDSKANDIKGKYNNMKIYLPSGFSSGDSKVFSYFEKIKKRNKENISFEKNQKNNSFSFLNHFLKKDLFMGVYAQNFEDDFKIESYLKSLDIPEMLNQKTLYKAYKYLSFNSISYLLQLQK